MLLLKTCIEWYGFDTHFQNFYMTHQAKLFGPLNFNIFHLCVEYEYGVWMGYGVWVWFMYGVWWLSIKRDIRESRPATRAKGEWRGWWWLCLCLCICLCLCTFIFESKWQKVTCNPCQGRVEEKMVMASTEASNVIKERPGQWEAGGGYFVAIFKKVRFLTVEKWHTATAEWRSRWQK